MEGFAFIVSSDESELEYELRMLLLSATPAQSTKATTYKEV
jgi:hypothetical protein